MPVNSISSINNSPLNSALAKNNELVSAQKKTSNSPNLLEKSLNLVNQNFLNQLQNKTTTQEKPKLEQMQDRLTDIQRKGVVLRHYPLADIADEYIGSIKSFLDDVREHAYGADFMTGEEGSKPIFEKINIADKKLDELADKLLKDEKAGLDLVASLGELEGLLIDILV